MNTCGSNKSNNSLRKECRYCLSDVHSEKLIDPCHCEGTMKYVHQECLQDWIINGNRQVNEITNEKNIKVYMSICEICKYRMTYTKIYKYNILSSFIKMIKGILGNWRNMLLFCAHSTILFFFVKRLKLFYEEFIQIFTKKVYIIHPDTLMRVMHNISVMTSIILGIGDIYSYYKKILLQKRKCVIKFLSKNDSD